MPQSGLISLARQLNEKLKPVGESTIDAGIRAEAETLLMSLLDAYASGTDAQRAAIRNLLRENSAFAWATHVPHSASTAEGFRMHLLEVSARWGIEDPRDLMLGLKESYEAARAAGVNTQPILSEIASLSEDSLADMLRRMR
ncbi:hypothetical protein ACFPN2_00890 [Steroidobacter flavus]|uniref:DUF2267 domain-containing protein n=1 Tax=Steroidobacter flavus TaxID=1842136 RepID=A0ABV8SJZ9_9GAMM